MSRNRVLRLNNLAPNASLELREEAIPVPTEDEVCLRFTSIGLNRADLLYQQNRYFIKPEQDSRLGFEGAGIVEIAGAKTKFKAGDRVGVCPMSIDVQTQGCLADYGLFRSDQLIPTPDTIPDHSSGAIWMAYLTAWGGLCHAGNLKQGETVFITAASSSVGIACIQLAKALGAHVIASSSSTDKLPALSEQGAEQVLLQPRDAEAMEAFESELISAAPQGIDLSFDAVTGPAFRALVRAAKRGGRIVVHGYLDRRPMDVHPGVLMKRLLSIQGYTLDATLSDTQQKNAAINHLSQLFDSGVCHPAIAKTFALEDYVNAFEYLSSNQQLGKVLIRNNSVTLKN